jgi:hypothetical protein
MATMHALGIFRPQVMAGAVARGAQWLDYDDTTFAARLAVGYLLGRWRFARRSGQTGSFAQRAHAEPQADQAYRCLWPDKDPCQQDLIGNTPDQLIRTPFAARDCMRPVLREGSETPCMAGCL